jgi:hypothetical protein
MTGHLIGHFAPTPLVTFAEIHNQEVGLERLAGPDGVEECLDGRWRRGR